MNTRSILLNAVGPVALIVCSAATAQEQVQDALDTQARTQAASVEVQQRINELDSQKADAESAYKSLMADVKRAVRQLLHRLPACRYTAAN